MRIRIWIHNTAFKDTGNYLVTNEKFQTHYQGKRWKFFLSLKFILTVEFEWFGAGAAPSEQLRFCYVQQQLYKI